MSAIHTWACFLIWISVATQDKTPDVHVTCIMSEECVLPCKFPPGTNETIRWFRQDVMVYSFQREDKDDGDSSEDDSDRGGLARRASLFPHLVSNGNASLVLKDSSPKDRGMYRCHVSTSAGVHDARVIVKVEAPIHGITLELSRLSGYEEMKCTARNVYPAPHVTWETEPPTFEVLRPITRKLANKRGLYMVDSRLKKLNSQADLIYICKVTASYGGQAWTASLRERVKISGVEGKDLTIPCHAPNYMQNPSLDWSFYNGEDDPAHILSYDSKSGKSMASASWDSHVELDAFRVPFGDGSVRLMDPDHSDHTGIYSCVFTMSYSTHTEHTEVIIGDVGDTEVTGVTGVTAVGERSHSAESSHLWIVGVVVGVLFVALVGSLVYLKFKGSNSKSKNNPEEATELRNNSSQ